MRLGLTAICGVVTGGLSSGFRSLLAAAIPDQLLLRATSVDAMVLEIVMVAGPVLVALLGTWDWRINLRVHGRRLALCSPIVVSGSRQVGKGRVAQRKCSGGHGPSG